MLRESPCERLYYVKDGINPAFVVCQDRAFRQRISYQEQAIDCKRSDPDKAAWLNHVHGIVAAFNFRELLFVSFKYTRYPRFKIDENLGFFLGLEANKCNDAVAKENRKAMRTNTKCCWGGG